MATLRNSRYAQNGGFGPHAFSAPPGSARPDLLPVPVLQAPDGARMDTKASVTSEHDPPVAAMANLWSRPYEA